MVNNKPEWMPKNPCKTCKIFEGVNEVCQPKDGAHCSNYSEYKSNLEALRVMLEYLNDKSATWAHGTCLDDECDCPYSLTRKLLTEIKEMK
jgi:hypothetical protein